MASRFFGVVKFALLMAGALWILSGCSSAPRAPGEASDTQRPPIAARLSPEQANEVTIHAISLVGTRYRYGGNTPESGFDCSGLIGYVYKARAGIAAPRTVAAMSQWGRPVPQSEVRTGDLVVFTQRGQATHAGIYVGAGRFVHAPSTGGDVRLDQLGSAYWSRQPTSFRRP